MDKYFPISEDKIFKSTSPLDSKAALDQVELSSLGRRLSTTDTPESTFAEVAASENPTDATLNKAKLRVRESVPFSGFTSFRKKP